VNNFKSKIGHPKITTRKKRILATDDLFRNNKIRILSRASECRKEIEKIIYLSVGVLYPKS